MCPSQAHISIFFYFILFCQFAVQYSLILDFHLHIKSKITFNHLNYQYIMQKLITITIALSILSLSSSVQIETEGRKHFPNIYSKDHGQIFVEPIQIYVGNVYEQQVMIDYSKVIDPKATRVEFMIFFSLRGDMHTTDYNFVRVQNSRDVHYNSFLSNQPAHFSQSFQFNTDVTNKLFLSIQNPFKGVGDYLVIYVTGYYI